MRPHSAPEEAETAGSVVPATLGLDAELIDSIAGGDRSAVETVYDRHSSRLYNLACTMCGPTPAADVVLAVFVDLWKHPQRFRGEDGSLGLLLDRDTHRRAVACLRQGGATPPSFVADLVGRRPGSGFTVDRVALRRFAGDPLADRLMALPASERDVIVLAYFGGYTCHELGALLGRTPATLTELIRSGLEHLRAGPSRPVNLR